MEHHLFAPPDPPTGDVDEEIEEDVDDDTTADGFNDFND
jgi:hypothetical protein